MNFDVATANALANKGELENWIDTYLRTGEWANLGLANGLKLQRRWWAGPLFIPIKELVRVCGPEPGMEYPQELQGWEKDIKQLKDSLKDIKAVPPFIAQYQSGVLSLRDGSHRHEAYKQLGWQHAWVLIWYDSQADFDADQERRATWKSFS